MKIKTTPLSVLEKQTLLGILDYLLKPATSRSTKDVRPVLQPQVVHWIYDFAYWKDYTEERHVISRIEFAIANGIPYTYKKYEPSVFHFIHYPDRTIEIPVKKKQSKSSKAGAIDTPHTKNLGELKSAFSKLDRESRYQILVFISRLCEDRYRTGLQHCHSQKGSSILAIRLDQFLEALHDLDLDSSPDALEFLEEDVSKCLSSEQRLRLNYGDLLYALDLRDLLTRP